MFESRWSAALLVAVLLSGCLCEDEVGQQEQSPAGRWSARVFTRNCGATTAYAHHVVVRSSGIIGWLRETTVFVSEGDVPTIRWETNGQLTVFANTAKVFRREPRAQGVKITAPAGSHL